MSVQPASVQPASVQPASAPLAVRLDAIHALAEVAKSALPIGMNAIFMTPDGVPGIAKPPRPSKLHFVADGLPFSVAVSTDGDASVCQIWAEVGHIPFTAQSPERRRHLLNILRGAKDLKRAKFVIQQSQKVLLFSETRIEGHVTPESLVYDTACLLQEARPFLRLLAEHL